MVFPKGSTNRGGRRRGGAALELALSAPVLFLVLVITVDYCRLFFPYTTITNAARNGALWLSDPLAPTQSPYADFQAAALADANNLNPALTRANVTNSAGTDGHGNATVTVTVQYQVPMVTSYLGFSSVSLSSRATMRVAQVSPN